MNKKRVTAIWAILLLLTTITSGCALIGTAITAGISYGIYQATRK